MKTLPLIAVVLVAVGAAGCPGLDPSHFHIRNARARFERTGDLFAGVLTNLQLLETSLEKLDEMVQGARK